MIDKIEGIRERHKESDNNFIEYETIRDIHVDRATLLAEVDRLRAEIERLRAEVQRQTRHVEQLYDQIRRRADERDKAQIEVERLREALESKP